MSRLVHHNKCAGGHAVEEVDREIYCLGLADEEYECIVYLPECEKCPRLLDNNLDYLESEIADGK